MIPLKNSHITSQILPTQLQKFKISAVKNEPKNPNPQKDSERNESRNQPNPQFNQEKTRAKNKIKIKALTYPEKNRKP